VSTAFPDATFRLLTGVPLGERSLELGEVVGDDPATASDTLREHPDVVAYDRLYVDDGRVLSKYETVEQSLYEFFGGTSLPPEFPLVVENGIIEFGITATRAQFESLGAALDATDRSYELLSVVHTTSHDDVLTARQRECLRVARRAGYFAVPRESTLAEVAAELGVDTSTASETLRRGSARVLDWFFLGPE
jgi:predicted DNA binding protein